MKQRTFFIPGDAIDATLAPGHGSCYATDRITVEGRRVGFMYREQPDNPTDSGWRFFDGTESQEYVDNPDNLAIYNVNTIANYDSDIIPCLDAPVGSAFERTTGTPGFVETQFPDRPDDVDG